MMTDPPPNPLGGKTLVVDANDGDSYLRPVRHYSMQESMTRCLFVPGSMKIKCLSQGDRFIWWGPAETRYRFFPVAGGPSTSSKSQAVVSPASRFDMSEAIRIQR